MSRQQGSRAACCHFLQNLFLPCCDGDDDDVMSFSLLVARFSGSEGGEWMEGEVTVVALREKK